MFLLALQLHSDRQLGTRESLDRGFRCCRRGARSTLQLIAGTNTEVLPLISPTTRYSWLTHSNLRLQSNSPCINAGDNDFVTTATDLDGNPRVVSGTVDIGAYEYQGTGSVISYAWLQQYGLPTDGSADFIDSDGDGMNNWQEWICGTCPTNAQSVLRLVSATPAGTNITVTWQSVAGVNYFLERSTNLASPFMHLASFIMGQAGTTSCADTNVAGPGQLFYRVGVLPSGTN